MTSIHLTPRFVFWALAALTLLISHDLVWLVQRGPGESVATSLRSAQHGYWGWTSVAILGIAIAAALGTLARTVALQRRARRLHAPVERVGAAAFVSRAGVAWVRLLAVVGIGFALQENVEHALAHGHVIGIGAVTGPEYPLALPVLALVTAAAALALAMMRAVERVLVVAIEAALRRLRTRAPRTMRRRLELPTLRRRRPMASCDAGRAPPLLLVGS